MLESLFFSFILGLFVVVTTELLAGVRAARRHPFGSLFAGAAAYMVFGKEFGFNLTLAISLSACCLVGLAAWFFYVSWLCPFFPSNKGEH